MNSSSDGATPAAVSKPLFFYKLNQLRLLGALLVFMTHMELSKGFVEISHLPIVEVIRCGHQALNFFFVLSGFLITYLMLREYHASGTVNIRNFYMRRILRVWPLYYLAIALAFIVGPHLDSCLQSAVFDSWRVDVAQHYRLELFLYCAILPNVANCILAPPSCAGQTWTVGVEEQFYVMWPLLFWLVRKRSWLMMPVSILSKHALLFALGCVPATVMANDAGMNLVVSTCIHVLKHFDIEGLGVGAFAAYLLVSQPRIIKFISMPKIRFGMVIPFLAGIPFMPVLNGHHLDTNTGFIDFGLADFLCAIAYGWACILLAPGDKPKTILGKFLNYGGTITYGFYMYHPLAILVFLNIVVRLPNFYDHLVIANLILYLGAFTLTMLISAISYEWYESRFQRLKRYFSYTKKPAPNVQDGCSPG